MKKRKFKKSFWQNGLSLLVIGVFMYIAMATIPGTNQQKFEYPDGRVEIAKTYSDNKKEIITGKLDAYEAWQGPTTIEYQNDFGDRTAFEEVNMKDGKRHGQSIITYPGGGQRVFCYDMGKRIDCEKSALIGDNTAYEILDYRYPWFTLKFNVFDFSDVYIQAFMDTFEIVISSIEENAEDFEDYYEDANDILSETHFFDIIEANAEFTLYYGMELTKFVEFRRAVIDQYRAKERSIYEVVKNNYPNYLHSLDVYGVTETDFEGFASTFDEVMNSYGALDENDPYFVDSLDTRMFRAMVFIYEDEEVSMVAEGPEKSLNLGFEKLDINKLLKYSKSEIKQVRLDLPPNEVATIIMSLIFLTYNDADLLKNGLHEWYLLKKGVADLPETTTSYKSRNSSSGVTIAGNITFDGGADISERGIVWGTGFNPMLTDNKIVVGNGSGSFETQINGLNESETYYARSFATNSAGTAYGNCIQFTTSMTVGNETMDLSDNDFTIYPNPASEKVRVSFKIDSPNQIKLSIISVNGQVVKQMELENLVQGENQVEINVSNLDNGFYSCRLTSEGNVLVSQKLVISR